MTSVGGEATIICYHHMCSFCKRIIFIWLQLRRSSEKGPYSLKLCLKGQIVKNLSPHSTGNSKAGHQRLLCLETEPEKSALTPIYFPSHSLPSLEVQIPFYLFLVKIYASSLRFTHSLGTYHVHMKNTCE